MKNLVFSAFMLAFGLVMLAGTTYAWFQEDVVVDNNIIVMGELDLHVQYSDPDEGTWYEFEEYPNRQLFDVNRIEPGVTYKRQLLITNDGNIPMAVRARTEITDDSDNLKEYLTFKVAGAGHEISGEFENLSPNIYLVLEEGESIIIDVEFTPDYTLGNNFELTEFMFDFTIEGRQIAEIQATPGTCLFDYDEITNTVTPY